MRHATTRSGFTAQDLLIVLAIIGFLVGMLVAAAVNARRAAGRIESLNNLRQLALACHIYHDTENKFPPGNDTNNFAAVAYLLPYLEQQNVSESIDFTKSVDDKANDKPRKVAIRLLQSPLDPQKQVRDDRQPTNYLFSAGSKTTLRDNDGVFFQNSGVSIADVTDGSATTLMIAETLKGDGGVKAVDVRRQHVFLTPEKPQEAPPNKIDEQRVQALIADLGSQQFEARKKAAEELEKLGEPVEPALKKALEGKPVLEVSQRLEQLLQKIAAQRRHRLEGPIRNLKEDAGAAEWKAGTHIVGDRCASWLDGRFLQGTFCANRPLNDDRPDVSMLGLGGLSSLRNMGQAGIAAAFVDGHAQVIPVTIKLEVWRALATRNGGEAVDLP